MRNILLTHRNCPDGSMCAVVWVLSGQSLADVRFCDPTVGVDVALDAIEDDRTTYVVCADVAPSPKGLERARTRLGDVLVFDHHKTNERLSGTSGVLIHCAPGVCGCTLLRDALVGPWNMSPELSQLTDVIAQFDTWTDRRAEAEEMLYLHTVLGQDGFVRRCIEACRPGGLGKRLSRFEAPFVDAERQKTKERTREAMSRAWKTTVRHPSSGGPVTAVVTVLDSYPSQTLNAMLLEHPEATFSFGVNPVSGYVSIRSRDPVDDCAFLGEKMGGGGHACAAAFRYTPSHSRDVDAMMGRLSV